MEVIVYTRRGCPLCDKGITRAGRVFGEDRVTLIDIDLDLALLERYTDRVPVIETTEGTVIDEGLISEAVLASYLELRDM
ncbi:MAG: glutaredoxin family protein [Actinomycetia bacterium]|nr:glutaredoxin family protein [Actinomycetes bacterium]